MKGNPDIKSGKGSLSKRNLVIFLPLVIIFLFQAYLFYTQSSQILEIISGYESVAKFLKTTPPKRTLESLSREFQERIEATQNKGCDGATLVCGHRNWCGFGCQIHHRIGCIVISLALNIPLIHNLTTWPYKEPWSEVFLPMGSNCPLNNGTIKWDWKKVERDKRFKNFDLRKGFPLWKEMIQELEKLHPNPFLWVVGQLVKYALRPSETLKKKLKEWKEKMKFQEWKDGGFVGIHVRRTDKWADSRNSWHELPDYFVKAQAYFDAMDKNHKNSRKRRLLIVSDDNTLFPTAMKHYPWWDIRGFNSTSNHMAYHWEGKDGRGSGWEIFRDTFLLAECEAVFCGLSSNVCRLVAEMMAFKSEEDSIGRIISMDHYYFFLFHEFGVQLKLVPYEQYPDLERLINLTLTIKNELHTRSYLLFQ